MTEVEAKRITILLVAAYPAWKPSEATMQLYERVLRPLSAALAEQAVLQIIRSPREFAPPVGVICERAARCALGRSGENTLGAEEAWAEISAAIRSRGWYRAPEFHNPALARTVAAMGWGEICTNPNVEATRAHFFPALCRVRGASGGAPDGRTERRESMGTTGRALDGGAACNNAGCARRELKSATGVVQWKKALSGHGRWPWRWGWCGKK
jgi:hypothetical protein